MYQLSDRYDKVIFLDTETSGLDPVGNQVIELAMLTEQKNAPAKEYDKFIKLGRELFLDDKITELTGITQLDLETKGIVEKQAYADLANELSGNNRILIIAYNAQFDISFLREGLKRQNDPESLKDFDKCDYLDAFTVFRDRAAYPHKLKNAIAYYHLEDKVKNSHRAIDDTKALKAVYEAMEKERDDMRKYVNLFGFNEKYGVSGEKLEKVTYRPQAFHKGLTKPIETVYGKLAMEREEQR